MASLLFKGKFDDLLNRSKEFSGLEIELFDAEDEDIDYSENMPDPPFTVRDRAHLFELLDAGIASPKEPLTEESMARVRAEVYRRLAERK